MEKLQIKQSRYKFFIICFVMVAFLSGCDSNDKSVEAKHDKRLSDSELRDLHSLYESQNSKIKQYMFGFDLRSSPLEDARQYLPFLKYLEQKTGYKFKLRFTPEDGKIIDDLGSGKIHFAAIGAVSYIKAAERYGVRPLVRGLNAEGKAKYRSMIIVKRGSSLRGLANLKGRRLAFGSKTSTQGHLIPRIVLTKNNIKLSDLSLYEYTGSHQNCADAVISGRFDACGLQDTMAIDLQQQQRVRILHRSSYYPSSGIAANKDVPLEVIKKVKQAMLDFKPAGRDAAILYNWHKTEMPNGFVASQKNDYILLREWLVKLGLIIDKANSNKKDEAK
jgi:phosphonate transport system substrate-binding protein